MEGERKKIKEEMKREGVPVREESSNSEAKYTEKQNPFYRNFGSDSALHCYSERTE